MSNDELLQQLARVARDDQEEELARLDERWDRLAAGTLAPEEEAALRAQGVGSPLARRAWEVFRPLNADFHQRVVAAVRQQAGATSTAPATPARMLGRGRTWGRRTGWLAAAAAAALIVVVLRPGGETWPPLPEYALQLGAGVQELRGAPETALPALPSFIPGSRFELVLRPARAVAGPVAAAAFAAREGEAPAPWPGSLEVAASGAVRLSGVLGEDLEMAPGQWHLWLAVGRPGELPAAAELDRPATAWQLLTTRFRVAAAAPEEPGV